MKSGWLFADTINVFMSVMQYKIGIDNIYFMSSDFFSKVESYSFIQNVFIHCFILVSFKLSENQVVNEDTSSLKYDYTKVQNWFDIRNLSIFQFSKIIVPIHINQNHWILGVIFFQEKVIDLYSLCFGIFYFM